VTLTRSIAQASAYEYPFFPSAPKTADFRCVRVRHDPVSRYH
jgi:hypothetical protein